MNKINTLQTADFNISLKIIFNVKKKTRSNIQVEYLSSYDSDLQGNPLIPDLNV